MKYAKIIVKNNYEQRGDLVLRSYVRALNKINASEFLDGDNALIYGMVDDNGIFYEMFTREVIDYDEYEFVDKDEYILAYASKAQVGDNLIKVIRNVLFNEDIELGFEISRMDELAYDRSVEFKAYDSRLSIINPYQRLTEEDPLAFRDYNILDKKLKAIKKIRKNDSAIIEDDEYEVSENPKRLIRK